MKNSSKKTQANKDTVALEKPDKTRRESSSTNKITVGADEFCPTCMEWRTYDEVTEKCVVCGCRIKRISERRKITDEYDLRDFAHESDEPPETGEF